MKTEGAKVGRTNRRWGLELLGEASEKKPPHLAEDGVQGH